jgi:Acetyltransferase (GNAT) domain
MSATATLLEDGGAAASCEEFFRSPQFLEAEGVTHSLCVKSGATELVAPLIVREIDTEAAAATGTDQKSYDAISPYGYPGIAEARVDPPIEGSTLASRLDPSTIDFSATGLVAVFLRHTLDEPPLSASSERNVVLIADPTLPPKSRPSDRNQINKNLRHGYELRLVPGPETTPAQRAGFLAAYEQTMRRTGAAERYFFGAAYFDRILESSQTWLALALAPDGEVAASSIAARSDGCLHYYLSGSADSNLRDSPMKNIVASLVELSTEQRLPLNLGGGISRGDRLEEFKRGFANRELPWRTSEIVCDTEAYERLAAGRGAGDFFPAYRAS